MRRSWRGVSVLLITLLVQACSDSRNVPTGPSSLTESSTVASSTASSPLSSPASVLDWACGQQTSTPPTINGWTFEPPSGACAAPRNGRLDIAAAAVTVAPGGFRATVTGNAVRLDWDAIAEPVVSHQLEAGSAPGLANIAL